MKNRAGRQVYSNIYLLLFSTGLSSPAVAEIRFQDATSVSGIDYVGKSFGAAWGDFNGDGWPDIWVSNHADPSVLYLNQANGAFADVTDQIVGNHTGDTHGAAWGDFDNDGDQDLVELVGANWGTSVDPNHLYVNEVGHFVDRASELGVDYPLLRGRTPLWLDYDRDGKLDLLMAGLFRNDGLAPPRIYHQGQNYFEDSSSEAGFSLPTATNFCYLADFTNDNALDLSCQGDNPNPVTIYDLTSLPFEDATSAVFPVPRYGSDAAVADYDGNLIADLYLTLSNVNTEAVQTDALNLKAKLVAQWDEKGIRFQNGPGVLTLELFPSPFYTLNDIYVGATGMHPTDTRLVLSKLNPDVQGIYPHVAGSDEGIYIGFDTASSEWRILISTATSWQPLGILLESEDGIMGLGAIGFDQSAPPLSDRLFLNVGGQLFEATSDSGINSVPVAGSSVVAGDFDNDMDVDIYIVATGPAANRPNSLLENQGNGGFIAIPDAGGAAGTSNGVGDTVVTADYDQDGFLDLFVTNGTHPAPFDRDGPYQLFRNMGNSNHWLEIDLEGVASNRDGVGARVFASAGGVTQLREQSGGIHRYSQNARRVHFGLGSNSRIDELVIEWPSGITQRIDNIPSNQIIRVIESSNTFDPGQPIYSAGVESGVFIWKETFDGPYHLRSIGAGEVTDFQIKLISTDILTEVSPIKLEGGDVWETTEYGFLLSSRTTAWEDGVDFRLPPKAKALLSITQDGKANPRQLHVGVGRISPPPAGWILSSDRFPDRPSFHAGSDLGLFMGGSENGQLTEFRWSGDGNDHRTKLTVIASTAAVAFSPVNLNPGDDVITGDNWVEIEGRIANGMDGADMYLPQPVEIGFAYLQDGLFPSHQVNALMGRIDLHSSLPSPNAYWLPLATPYGVPDYNPASETGVFVWKEPGGMWRVRFSAGGGSARYVGTIISDEPAVVVNPVSLESNDMLDVTDPTQIVFDLNMISQWQDGIDFQFPENASVVLNLQTPSGGGVEYVRVGASKWPVQQLPVDLGGW